MTLPMRFSDLPEYAFPRLRSLLDTHTPGGTPVHMSIGEPKHPVPDIVSPIIAKHTAEFSKYPPNEGLPGLRGAISDWIARRYGVSAPDPERHILPLNGTREGLFNACLALCPETKGGEPPVVLLPNPFYQCYAVAALAVGAEPHYVSAGPETGFLPDFAALPEAILNRTAIVYMCSPSNPQGAVASLEYWKALLTLAEKYDFRVFADECYSEIYRDTAPTGVLEALEAADCDPERILAFHSLSKRSNLAGLRSGAVTGGTEAIGAMKQLRSYAGAPLPIPLQHAATAVWQDEAHVETNRALYRAKFDLADQILGNMAGYTSPQAGFFLWIKVHDGEDAALKLWQKAGIRVLPGLYLSRDPLDGSVNPGASYIRAALVAPIEEVSKGLTAIRDILGPDGQD